MYNSKSTYIGTVIKTIIELSGNQGIGLAIKYAKGNSLLNSQYNREIIELYDLWKSTRVIPTPFKDWENPSSEIEKKLSALVRQIIQNDISENQISKDVSVARKFYRNLLIVKEDTLALFKERKDELKSTIQELKKEGTTKNFDLLSTDELDEVFPNSGSVPRHLKFKKNLYNFINLAPKEFPGVIEQWITILDNSEKSNYNKQELNKIIIDFIGERISILGKEVFYGTRNNQSKTLVITQSFDGIKEKMADILFNIFLWFLIEYSQNPNQETEQELKIEESNQDQQYVKNFLVQDSKVLKMIAERMLDGNKFKKKLHDILSAFMEKVENLASEEKPEPLEKIIYYRKSWFRKNLSIFFSITFFSTVTLFIAFFYTPIQIKEAIILNNIEKKQSPPIKTINKIDSIYSHQQKQLDTLKQELSDLKSEIKEKNASYNAFQEAVLFQLKNFAEEIKELK